MTASTQHHAFQFFCGEQSGDLACLPFPGSDHGLIVALGANITTVRGPIMLSDAKWMLITYCKHAQPCWLQAHGLGSSAVHFRQEAVASIVLNHYYSTEQGRFEHGGALMEFEHAGGPVTSICACGSPKLQGDLNSCIVSGSTAGELSAIAITVPQRATSSVEDITVRFCAHPPITHSHTITRRKRLTTLNPSRACAAHRTPPNIVLCNNYR
jgi:hypothetical protein